MTDTLTIGANQAPLAGPGVLTHQGGDPILIAEVENGLPGEEVTLVFEGSERTVDGDDQFHPADPETRSFEVSGAVLVRALGQASASFSTSAAEAPEAPATTPHAEPSHQAKQKAKELGVDIHSIEGTGKNGRVTVSDVREAANAPAAD